MYAVHPVVSRGLPKEEYGVFTTLLQVVTLMTIPAGGLQPVIAQQQAAAITDEQQRVVASEFRAVVKVIFFIWLAMAAVAGVFWPQALAGLKIHNPAALGMTVVIGLAAMWMPLVMGILQGRQNFFWLGWTSILNGVGRFGLICVVVLIFHGWAAGAMGAVFLGMSALIVIGGWQVRDVWKIEATRVEWKNWLARIIPLTLGLGAANFMLSADMIFTQKFFPARSNGLLRGGGNDRPRAGFFHATADAGDVSETGAQRGDGRKIQCAGAGAGGDDFRGRLRGDCLHRSAVAAAANHLRQKLIWSPRRSCRGSRGACCR